MLRILFFELQRVAQYIMHEMRKEIFGWTNQAIWGGRDGIHPAQDRHSPVADSSEHGNEPSASIKCGKFLDFAEWLLAFEGLCSIELISWLIN